MTTGKYNDLSIILSKYNFAIDSTVLADFNCIICKRILRNATQSSCGCNFCWECIENYLGDSSKLCPSGRICCAHEFLTMAENIQIDHRVNRNISFLKVMCPNDGCKVEDQLGNIGDHIRICEKGGVECPYASLGCGETNVAKDELTTHLSKNIFFHGTMVTESIKHISNELSFMKGVKENIAAMEIIERSLAKQVEDQRIEIETLKSNNLSISQAVQDLVNVKKSGFYPDILEKIDQLEAKIDKVTNNITKFDDFVWKIEEFSSKQKGFLPKLKKELTSSSFFTHKEGYKMRLKVHPNGFGAGLNTHLFVSFSLMKSDFDDKLDWPFKHTVKLSILDQETGKDHISYSFHYDTVTEGLKDVFQKPKGQINKALGDDEFIRLDELMPHSSLLVNDCIFIKCSVNIC